MAEDYNIFSDTDTPEVNDTSADITEVITEAPKSDYGDDAIKSLESMEHIRLRPGMYIGKLGDGSHAEDGIYVLMKEVIDNSIDEFNMGAGKKIDIKVTEEGEVTIRDYGRGIPLLSVKDVASKINTGGKFDDRNFQKSVGLNGVGLKAVNALSRFSEVRSFRDGKTSGVKFERGVLMEEDVMSDSTEENGTMVKFQPDNELFRNYGFREEFIETMVNNYTYLNAGLSIYLNGKRYISRHGLLDLLRENITSEPLYPIIHLKGEDIEVVLTHTDQYGEEYYSFVNGQHTSQGGTHLSAFREHLGRTIKEFSGKGYDFADIRNGMVAAIAIRIQEPVFESQTKVKLGSKEIAPKSPITVNKFVGDFIKKELDDYLHKNPDTAALMLKKIAASEKERKAIAGVTKTVKETIKKASLHNKKLRDCRIHLNDAPNKKNDQNGVDLREESSIFITEGDSASGTITKVRNAMTQAVFSLRGKPKNAYGQSQKTVYENEEFNLLKHALNVSDGMDGLRYNKVIIATDADVDGMHIRLLIITYLLLYFPDLVKKGHVYILQTPLFRVRDKNATKRKSRAKAQKEGDQDSTVYCYTDDERIAAIEKFGDRAEITRFKGLGEINDSEFKEFIGPAMRLEPVSLRKSDTVDKMLEFYMGKNTMDRQNFIIENLVVEDDSEI